MGQRGTSLIELVIATAIMAVVAVAAVALCQGVRAFGKRSAAVQFDAVLAYAQALASTSGNGATLVFEKRPEDTGFVLTVYSGRPTAPGAMHRTPSAPMTSNGEVREAALGGVPFTIFLNSAGHASGMTGTVTTGTVLAGDPGCPSGESSVVLTFSDPRAAETRSIACTAAVAGTPVVIGTAMP